jgi:hypothetical protein
MVVSDNVDTPRAGQFFLWKVLASLCIQLTHPCAQIPVPTLGPDVVDVQEAHKVN